MPLHYDVLTSCGLIMRCRRMMRLVSIACTLGFILFQLCAFSLPLTGMNTSNNDPNIRNIPVKLVEDLTETIISNSFISSDPDSIGNGEPYPGYDAMCVRTDPPPNCNSNDFTFLSAFLASDTLGNMLTDCEEGAATIAYLCLTFNKSNASNRRGFYISTSISDGDSSIYTVNQCFDQIFSSSGEFTLCIPDNVVTFTCGTQLNILDTYFAWGSSNAASNICNINSGCASPKCDFFKGESMLISPLVTTFDFNIICSGLDTIEKVKFTNMTVGGSATYTQSWDFGDGTTSTLANPEHIYNAIGTYSVKLIIDDSIGITDSIVKDIMVDSCSTIHCQISGNISICEGDSLLLMEDSGWGQEWSWNGPNGFIDSSAQIIIHPSSLSDSGPYSVVVADDSNVLDSCQVTVTIFEEYVESISHTRCSGDGYSITINDSIFNEANPTGTIVMNSINGCDSTVVIQLQYNPQVLVEAGILEDPACSNTPINLSNLGATINGGINTGQWTTSGSGIINNNGKFNGIEPATIYTMSSEDIDDGQVILFLTSDDPNGACDPVLDSTIVMINDLRCSLFPFSGN